MLKRICFIVFCVIIVPVVLYWWANQRRDQVDGPVAFVEESQQDSADPDSIVAAVVDKEKLLREINPLLGRLNRAVLNLELLDEDTRTFFCDPFLGRDPVELELSANLVGDWDNREIMAGDLRQIDVERRRTGLWAALIKPVQFFEQVRFYGIKVTDSKNLPQSFTTQVGFQSLGRTEKGTWLSVESLGEIEWVASDDGWRVAVWDFPAFQLTDSRYRLFDDATEQCLSPSDANHVRSSKHYDILRRVLRREPNVFEDLRQEKYFPHIATGRHPSLSIVDIDNDGWDDLYIVEQWRPNLLFRNRGNGTFEEAAARFGLDIPGYGTSALFADFDNDGDQDLFLGRSLRRSQYLENQDGQFVERSNDLFPIELPYLVSSLSAVDYNRDGLLDIYVSTYGFLTAGVSPREWTREFLDRAEASKVIRLIRSPDYNRYLNAAGPANLLLENRGDRFEISRFSEQLAGYANTLQSTWADYDLDGDPDLYVANDFARDYLYRNDGETGFADVTLATGDETMMGFGMGASWGDFDLDGWQDLYVSNMYSKAGIRIVEQFADLDPRFRRSADGNRLYRFDGNRFQLVSANEGPGLNVHKAGWSWGGQFVDVNNDGYRDIYVTSGYFTAPQEFATDKDL